ncbi:2OG-Fe(II)-dependent halogenase WelO5 family protein [Legionella septentrionalis]|uniref:2OG-Fe(II)-dependent halogenase WelO5 family protein n=1 Tax=Legionella septentrionalis TaxID=2498109 RepID=UPI000F8E7748|nr:2OG-Fe(II) oxygenase [Legionella septentrionalis]RUQ94634.1 hypothetical protein ELY11_10890 [Legionella septentrionalis]
MSAPLISSVLSAETLRSLCNNDLAAIWIKEFYPLALCECAVDKILHSNKITYYSEAPDFKRIGDPYSLAYESHKNYFCAVEDYFFNTLGTINHIRDLFHPYYSPIDNLRLKLDESWPGGACLKTVKHQKYLAGIIRILTSDTGIPPHKDRYLALYPDIDNTYQHQITANIYLAVPEEQGALMLWLDSNSDIPINQENNLAVFSELDLGPPKLIIQPAQGDLVLFNPCLLHAVAASSQGLRISSGLFIGLSDINKPLEYWS